MSDLFKDKAKDWDGEARRLALSNGIGGAIVDAIVFTDDMQVMDFGAGTGLVTSHVAPLVASVVAVDTSAAMLEQLVAKQALRGKVEAVQRDILAEPLDRRFDVIISAMAMHHVEDTAAMLAAFAAHTRAGGRVALADLDSEDGSFHPADTHGVFHSGFDRAALGAGLEAAGFSDVRFSTATTMSKEGKDYPIFLVTAVRSAA